MKIHILAIAIIILLSGCASIKKDLEKERLGNEKIAKKKERDAREEERKITELSRLSDWFSYRYAFNKVQRMSPFTQPYSFGNIYFEMYYDENEIKTPDYYDIRLHVDLKWVQNPRTAEWEMTEKGQPIHEGVLYINPALKIAVYYYPRRDGEFDVFKVRIKSQTPKAEDAKPGDTKPGAAKPGDTKPGAAKPAPAKPGAAKK
jgi:hypothetical protein